MLNSSLLPLYCSKYDMQSIWSVAVHFCSLISESNNRKCIIRMLPIYTYVESYLSLVFEHDTFCEFGSIAFRPSVLYMNWIPDYFLNGFYICTRDPLQRWSGHSSEKHFHTNQKNWTLRSNERTKSVKMSKQRDTECIGLVYTTGQTFGIITICTLLSYTHQYCIYLNKTVEKVQYFSAILNVFVHEQMLKCNLLLWSKLYFQHHYSSLQCHMIFRKHSNMLIWCSVIIIYSWYSIINNGTENSTEKYIWNRLFCKTENVFATFDHFLMHIIIEYNF